MIEFRAHPPWSHKGLEPRSLDSTCHLYLRSQAHTRRYYTMVRSQMLTPHCLPPKPACNPGWLGRIRKANSPLRVCVPICTAVRTSYYFHARVSQVNPLPIRSLHPAPKPLFPLQQRPSCGARQTDRPGSTPAGTHELCNCRDVTWPLCLVPRLVRFVD